MNKKKLVSVFITFSMLASLIPTTALAAAAPILTVVSAKTGASSGVVNEYGYLISAVDPATGAALDVKYGVSSTNEAAFANLPYTAVAANNFTANQFGGMTQFYVKASTYSNATGLTTQNVFGPFSLDTSTPSITITSGLPNSSQVYDSFTVSYILEDTYTGVDMEASGYTWSHSSSTSDGYVYKFATQTGSITTPSGLTGTQYLHLNVMDKAGHTTKKVIGPINLSGKGSAISFSGIQNNGSLTNQTATITLTSVGTGINFSQSYYTINQSGYPKSQNKVYLNSLVTPVVITTPGTFTIDVFVADNSGNIYTATSPAIVVGKVQENASVVYNPNASTSGTVTATIKVWDSNGGYVVPVTSGLVQVDATTFQYTFSANGTLDAKFRTTAGSIITVPLNVFWITNSGNFFTIAERSNGNGVTVTMNQPNNVDFSRSYYQIGDVTRDFRSQVTNISLSNYSVQEMKAVVYSLSGQKYEQKATISYLPKGVTATLRYVDGSRRTTAKMSWRGMGSMVEYPRDWDSRYDDYEFEFDKNGYTTVYFEDKYGNEISFNLYVDWLSGSVRKISSNTSSSGRTSGSRILTGGDKYIGLELDTTKISEPILRIDSEYGTDFKRSYYQIDGGRKIYIKSDKEYISVGRNTYEYDVKVYVEDKRGNYVIETFSVDDRDTKYEDEIYKNGITVEAYDLDSSVATLKLSTDRGQIDLDDSFYRLDGGKKKYFDSTKQTISIRDVKEIYVEVYNSRGDKASGSFYTDKGSKYDVLDTEIEMTGLTTNKPQIQINTKANVDYTASYFTVNSSNTKYGIKSSTQPLNLTGTGAYTVTVHVITKSGRETVKTFTGSLGFAVGPVISSMRYSGTNKPKYISGYTDGTIRPDSPVTRAEFYQMLSANVVGTMQSVAMNSYQDVVPGNWYYNAVNRFVVAGVAIGNGYMFNPNEPITRGEAAAILVRLNLNADVMSSVGFSDVSGHKYQTEILAAARKGLIAGYTDGSFRPDYGIRRSEAVAIVNNAAGRKSDANSQIPYTVAAPAAWEVPATHWAYYHLVDAMNGHVVGGKTTTGSDIWTLVANIQAN